MATQLGIEIGGTKLQLGVGHDGKIVELLRDDVVPSRGALGIMQQIFDLGRQLQKRHSFSSIGVGFGGPVQRQSGRVTKSHQIHGWDDFPLADSLRDQFHVPVAIDNDCNVAALGEAKLGAGRSHDRVFYVTVGTGIGGGFVTGGRIDGKIDGADRPAIAEIGHLRPGLEARHPGNTVESLASGWGIAATARRMVEQSSSTPAATQILDSCQQDLSRLTTKLLADLARSVPPNSIAAEAIAQAAEVLGWGIAQTITLLAPEIVVIGGGVTMSGADFLEQVRNACQKYVFPPLAKSYQVVPAQLGELVVVHGALLLVA